ncbi:MAG TPA: winged helix-turn-helix domain-containing protein [Vicinamibacterales bacterium]|nr:winged helix-turn-helix domain-containing protein [Vicinamibacterales bacterium]
MGDPENRGAYRFGPFQLDVRERRLSRGTEVIPLRLKVFETLRVLVEKAGRLVTKQELLDAVWPDTTVEENNLNHNVSVLRKALGEKATGQQYIETVPRVGYRFVAAIETAEPIESAPADDRRLEPGVDDADRASATGAAPLASRERRWRIGLVLLAVLLVAAVASFYLTRAGKSGRVPALTEKDSVLIADFANTTGDQIFDGTLRHAIAVELGQSPILNIVSEERIRETLRYIGRSPDERVTRDLAREIAQRQGVKAVLIGSIASFGRNYVINLEVLSAASGETVAREQAEAESRERILARLGEAATRLRGKLGESLASIERFSAPIEQATTASLEAFKAYDLGRRNHFRGQYFEAIPLYRRAVELDPEFAMAYAALGLTFGMAKEYDLAAQFSQRAFALRHRVSERERFYISLRYYMDVLGDGDRAIEVLELWKQTYPRDFVPRTNLSARYSAIGRYREALEEAREGVRLNPDAGVAHAAVAHTALCLGQHEEATAAIEQARARKLDPPYSRYMLYASAFLQGDAAAMQQQVDHVSERPAGAGMLAMQSVTAAYAGRVRQARELMKQAIGLATAGGLEETAGLYAAADALWEAAYGNCREAEQATARALALSRGRHALSRTALAVALCGDSILAEKLTDEMVRLFPHNSFYEASWLPMVHAAVSLHRGDAAAAVERLKRAERVELGTDASLWPAYLRGLAYLHQGAGAEARLEFQKILDNKGVLVPKDFNPAALTLYPLAYLGRARAAAQSSDVDASRLAYEALLALWQGADSDIAIVRTARREYRQLDVPPAAGAQSAKKP